MKKTLSLCAICCAIGLVFYACKKNASAADVAIQNTAMQNSTDYSRVDGDNESFGNDILSKIESNPTFITLGAGDTLKSCESFIDKTQWLTAAKTIVVTYKDSSCNKTGLIRSGVITVQLVSGAHWYSAGAVLKLTFTSLKIIPFIGSAKSYLYNGVRYVTNVSGGMIFGYVSGAPLKDTIVHTVRATDTVTFEDGTKRTWWVARKNTYVKASFTLISAGDTTVSGASCTIGGATRDNTNFVVQSPQAIVSKIACGWYNPQAGIRKIVTDNQTVTVTFGVNASGTQMAAGLGCGDYFGYKLEWKKQDGTSDNRVFAY